MQELADKIARTRDAEGYLDPMSSIHEYALGSFSCIISQNRLLMPFVFVILVPGILYSVRKFLICKYYSGNYFLVFCTGTYQTRCEKREEF
jgi:hypothetical protein